MAENSSDYSDDDSAKNADGDQGKETSSEKTDSKEEQSDDEILKIAHKRFKLAVESEGEMRKVALEDLKFRAGDQWPDQVKNEREQDSRPCLTINRFPQFGRQVINDLRQNPTEIKVNPVDDNATPETAKIIQGMVRHIQYKSNASVAYDTGAECAVNGGFGYWRVITNYVSEMSFQQEILIKRIRDAFSVYLDPHAQEPDGSDINWGFIVDDMSEDDYKLQYPDSEMAKNSDWESIGKTTSDWASQDTCRIAEYFCKIPRRTNICQLSNGRTCLEEELPNPMAPGVTVVDKRETIVNDIKWFKINAIEILDRTDWLGKFIPIIPVYGNELFIDGKRIVESLFRYSKDSQRMSNYFASAEAETIALAPKAPWIGAEGQFEGHEEKWAAANRKNYSYLEYKNKSLNGENIPPPSRQAVEAPIQALTQARNAANEDLKATTGIYDPSIGNRNGADLSGRAIQRLNTQSQTSNFHFVDNQARSIQHTGRICVDLIPKIYKAPDVIRILHDDGTPEVVKINQIFHKDGKEIKHMLDLGEYDVTVSSGPGYATKREEALASTLDLTGKYPNMVPYVADLMVKNMDWSGADEISQRLKAMVPQAALQMTNGKNTPDPQMQAKLAQQGQMIQQLVQHLNAATEQIKTKSKELESKERIEMAKLQTDLTLEAIKLDSSEAKHQFDQEMAMIQMRLEALGINAPINQFNDKNAGPSGMATGTNTQQQTGQPTGG